AYSLFKVMDFLSKTVADIILFIGEQAQIFWGHLMLLNFSWPQILLDILLVSIFFYLILLLIKGSRAVHILIGLSIIGIIYFLSKALQLVALAWLLDRIFTVVLVAIPIIFQKELRMGLERLGHTKLFLNQKKRQIDRMILNIVDACDSMAKDKIGALIVIQRTIPLKEFLDTGIELQAKVSSELLLSIFKPKSPLHDGAVIISGERIQAASCILPHSFENTATGMGTRHKAALGLSENTDASIVVVSEEKGTISFAKNGKMERNVSAAQLQSLLHSALQPPKKKKQVKSNK
ncbi:diadenylate cyclase CdaA, partial [Patescibacteria group bacterium]|nr:diadenylate cyclase CdaA [Patescibacteria group bacterium]